MSEDITPRQPDRLDQLLTLVQSMDGRLQALEQDMAIVKDRLQALEQSMDGRLQTLEQDTAIVKQDMAIVKDRLAPTNQLPKIYAEVQEIALKLDSLKDEFIGFALQTRADIRDLKRSFLKIEEWIDHTEAQKK